MANTIKLKRGTSTPSTSDIASGEVAVDTSAKKLYINDSGTVKEIGGGVISDAQQNTVGDSSITKFRVPGINFTVKDTTATEDYVLTVDANGEAGWEAASGGGGENGLLQMAQTVSSSVTLTTNYNAFSVQPTIASGVTVTVPSGAVWAII
jgi:hypothetical protein